METISYIIICIVFIFLVFTGCTVALLDFWYFGKEDIKKYLSSSSDINIGKKKGK